MDAARDLSGPALAGLDHLDLDAPLRKALGRYGHPRQLRPGQTLCSQGEVVDQVFLVLGGRLFRVKYRSDDSLGPLPGLVPGDWCGLPESLSGSSYLADVRAEESCLVLAFGLINFRSLLEGCAEFRERLPRILARELVLLHHQLADAGPLDRIISYLLGQRRQIGSSIKHSVSITQAELGLAVGCTRETVNKYLGLLQARGLIEVQRSRIVISDWEALSNYQ
jgi:CRP-like cAMP-binding protein